MGAFLDRGMSIYTSLYSAYQPLRSRKIQIFQKTSDGEMIKIKVLDLKKLSNFIVDKF